MKILFVFFLCYLAVAVAWSYKDEKRVKRKAGQECMKEMKVTEEDLKNRSIIELLCLCMHKKVGYMKADGTLNIKRVVNGHPNIYFRDMVRKEYQKCLDKAEGNLFKASLCFEEWYN